MLADSVEDDVVRLTVLREVILQVVDHLVGAERAHELDVLRVGDGGDMRAEVLGELNGRCPERPGGAVHDDALLLERLETPEADQRGKGAVRNRGRLLERQAGGHVRDPSALLHESKLGMGAEAVADGSEDLVADRVLVHPGADLDDDSGEVAARLASLRLQEPRPHEAPEDWICPSDVTVRLVDGRRADLDEQLVVRGCRPGKLLEPKYLRRAVPVVHN